MNLYLDPKPFRFKDFTIHHHRSAFKVNTDAVLLAAWADFTQTADLLDIGTGTGLIAIIAAMKNEQLQAVGIEIDQESALQARFNVNELGLQNRIEIIQKDIKNLKESKFDTIISNPPFFQNATRSLSHKLANAKHNVSLGVEDLLKAISKHLKTEGKCFLVLSESTHNSFVNLVAQHKLFIHKITGVKSFESSKIFNYMYKIAKFSPEESEVDTLHLYETQNVFSSKYKNLTKDYYLKM